MNIPIPFLKEIQNSKNVLIHGIGGGYDVFTGIPLGFELKNIGKNVFFGSFSFAYDLEEKGKRDLAPNDKTLKGLCFETHYLDYLNCGEKNRFDEKLGYPNNYFPEFHLSRWFYEKFKEDVGVYAFTLRSKKYLQSVESYSKLLQKIVDKNQIDAVLLIDAGVDSLIKGNEEGVGTYSEDFLSMLSFNKVKVKKKFLFCVGCGTEGGISIYDFFENLQEIDKDNGFYGSSSFHKSCKSVQLYLNAVNNCCPVNTTINQCIIGSILSNYGSYSNNYLKQRGCFQVFVHPLMNLTYFFDLNVVMKKKLFIQDLEKATSLINLDSRFEVNRLNAGIKNVKGRYIGKRKYKKMF